MPKIKHGYSAPFVIHGTCMNINCLYVGSPTFILNRFELLSNPLSHHGGIGFQSCSSLHCLSFWLSADGASKLMRNLLPHLSAPYIVKDRARTHHLERCLISRHLFPLNNLTFLPINARSLVPHQLDILLVDQTSCFCSYPQIKLSQF